MNGGFIIPDDWDGVSYVPVILCVPWSSQWLGLTSGAVSELANAYNYNEDTGDILQAKATGLEIYDSMNMCDEILDGLNSIATAITGLAGNTGGCQVGSDIDTDNGEQGGPVPAPVDGVPYGAASGIANRKCKAANYIHNGVRDVVAELRLNRVDQYGYTSIQFVLTAVATIVGALVAGPFGALVGAVAGGSLAMATNLFKASFNLTLLLTSIEADEEGAICTLYTAYDADSARAAYLAHLTGEGATTLETEFVKHLLTNSLLNLLFFSWGDSEDAIDDVTITFDCSSGPCADSAFWDFVSSAEGWTYVDSSTPGSSASMAWNAGTEALRNTHVLLGSPGETTEVEDISPLVAVPSSGALVMEVGFGAPSDGLVTTNGFVIEFQSSPDETIFFAPISAPTIRQHTIATVDIVSAVKVVTGRSTGGGSTPASFAIDVEYVKLQ